MILQRGRFLVCIMLAAFYLLLKEFDCLHLCITSQILFVKMYLLKNIVTSLAYLHVHVFLEQEDDARVKRAFQTLLTYIGNVARNPDEEKFRKIRLSNQSFQVSNSVRYCPHFLNAFEP